MVAFKVPGEDQLTPMTQGADLAAKMINSEGGFGGRPAKVISCNSMLQPAAAEDCVFMSVACPDSAAPAPQR